MLLLSNIAWDCDGLDPVKDCKLPTAVLVVGEPGVDTAKAIDVAAEELMEVYGFLHGGCRGVKVEPDVRGRRSQIGVDAVMAYPKVAEADKPDNTACLWKKAPPGDLSTTAAVIQLAREDLAYAADAKSRFHLLGRQLLVMLADRLGYADGAFEVRSNPGGAAVSGEIVLHSGTLYVQLSASANRDRFMWRTCSGRDDFTGDANQWAELRELFDLTKLAAKLQRAVALKAAAANRLKPSSS